MMKKEKVVVSAAEIQKVISGLAARIISDHPKSKSLVLIGIQTRGVPLTERLKTRLEKSDRLKILSGTLDITLYRDDLAEIGPVPVVKSTDIGFDLTGKDVILVDDVLFTGRTIRAALNELMDFGRPATVKLAVLVDRGCRELPIQADYVGKYLKTTKNQIINVSLKEIDGKDEVILSVKL